jgi:hypothetical protein
VRDDAARCEALIRACPWLMEALAAVRSTLPVPAWIGAGGIRAAVWDGLHGFAPAAPATDIDVVFFDAADTAAARDAALQAALRRQAPRFDWDVTNQAGVHLWYAAAFGPAIAPYASLEEGIASWPETATAVAARLTAEGDIDIVAPLGLADLLDMTVRWNPALVSGEQYWQRVTARNFGRRWPRVQVLPP